MALAEVTHNVNTQLAILTKNITDFFSFLGNKLKNFKSLTPGEQIAFSSIGVGLILTIIALVMLVV
ncbi:hypothetical protein HYX14_01310 [Candidatus Woesearchaeota archaeon]|nr:hypothetical protein [Candidatus Woesearchaeota archaeon]